MGLIDNILPELSIYEKEQALLNAQKICFQNGLTTVDDAGLMKFEIDAIDELQKSGKLNILPMSLDVSVDVPTNKRDFFGNIRYTCFGLGDKSYFDTYNRFGRIVIKKMDKNGAKSFFEYGEGDEWEERLRGCAVRRSGRWSSRRAPPGAADRA